MVAAIKDEKLKSLSAEELNTRENEILGALNNTSDINSLSFTGLDIREQELLDRLSELGIEPPISTEPPIINPQDEIQRDSDIEKMALSWSLAEVPPKDLYLNYSRFKKDEKSNEIGFVETIKETRFLEKLFFVGPVFKTSRILELFDAAERLNLPDGTMVDDKRHAHSIPIGTPLVLGGSLTYEKIAVEKLREQDTKTVSAWIEELEERQSRGISIGGRIAEGITDLPAFMVEFLLTGGIFKVGSIATEKVAIKLLGRFAEKGVGRLATKVAAAGFGTLARTAVNVPRIMQGAVENMAEGIEITDDGAAIFSNANKPFSALALSFADLYIENITEISGPSLKKGVLAVGTGIGKKFPVIPKITQAIADKWISGGAAKGITRTLGDFLKASATKVGYDGILEEMGEEQLGRIIRSATGLQSFDEILPTWEDLLVEAGIFAVPGSVSLATTKLFRKDVSTEPIEKRLGLMTTEEFTTGLQSVQALNATQEAKVVRVTAETKANDIIANAKEASVESTGTIDAIGRNILRAEDALGFWGKGGKKVQKDLREISARTAVNVGNTTQNIKAIFKGLNAKEKVIVAQLTDGAIAKESQPPRLIERARMLKSQLDKMQNEALDVELRKGKLTGKAFPQIPNKKGIEFLKEAEVKGAQSQRVFAWAQTKVTEGKFKSVDLAIAALQNYRKDRLRGTEGYFEGQRTVELDLDMREWNPGNILPGIIEGGWEAIEGARQWGVTKDGNFKKIRTSIEQIRGEIGRDQANMLENYIKAQYGQSIASVTSKVWSRRARAIQFVGKLAISPLTITRNMLDRYAKGLTHGTIGTNIRATVKFPPFLNKFMKTSQKIQDEMIRQGAVLGHGHLSEGFASGGKIQRFIGQPFALSERGNQTYIAIVKKMQLEADIKRLHEMGGETGTIGRMYDRMLTLVGKSQLQTRNRVLTNLTNEQLADAMAGDKISDDIMSEVLHRTVTDSAFPLTLASKRMWWGNRPWVQTMTQFKVWSADQMRFIYKDVLKYTVATGDPSRLARFILGTWIAGEIYNIARDFLTDRDESLVSTLIDESGRNFKDISKSVANDLVDGGIVGMLADLTYGITDWAFGPTVGSIESIARISIAVKNDPATTVDGLKKFLLDDIPAAKQAQGILDKIDRTFFNENNLTENYAKWRQRSFDFRQKKGELTTIERATGRAILGRPTRLPGPRTLSLEMIARQVLVGDAEDAADYIVGIFEDTKLEKIKDLRAAFRQSAINNSPIGNMKKADIAQFINQFPEKEKEEILSLQRQWIKNYSESLKIALTRLKEEGGFIDELKKEFNERRKELEELK